MAFNFQKFTETETSFSARITIRQTGHFGFNVGAINRFGIAGFDFVVLYFDPEQRVIGMELQKSPTENSIEIKKSESNTFIRAKNFCDRFGIDYSGSHRFELRKDDESGFLYFELRKELTKETAE